MMCVPYHYNAYSTEIQVLKVSMVQIKLCIKEEWPNTEPQTRLGTTPTLAIYSVTIQHNVLHYHAHSCSSSVVVVEFHSIFASTPFSML